MGSPISRRRFLHEAAATAPIVASALPRAVSGATDQPRASRHPIVVVGAGLAGLRAADILRKAGRQVVVLEARSRAGGRVLTLRSPFDDGLHGEAGPVRIAGAHQAVLRAVRAFRLPLVPFESSSGASLMAVAGRPASSSKTYQEGTSALQFNAEERALTPRALLERYVGDLPTDLAEPAATPASYAGWQAYDRVSWPDWLRSRGASPGAITLMTLGGDSSHVSALYLLRQFAMLRHSTVRYKIRGGMDALPRAMATALGDVVRHNAAVVRLTRRASEFQVEYEQQGRVQSVTASRVIFAVPFSTLRQIEIRPAFSRRKQTAIESLSYHPVSRFLLQSRTRFWHDAGLNGSARTDRGTEIWDCTYDDLEKRRGIIGANAGGATSREASGMSGDDSLRFGIGLVADALPAIRTAFEKGTAVHWGLEPWSRGAFAIFGPGQMSAMMPDMAQPEDGVHFAGEHTSSWTGWMEGALQSGERVASEVLASEPHGVTA